MLRLGAEPNTMYVNGDGMDTGVFSVVAARVLYFFSAPPPLRRGGRVQGMFLEFEVF